MEFKGVRAWKQALQTILSFRVGIAVAECDSVRRFSISPLYSLTTDIHVLHRLSAGRTASCTVGSNAYAPTHGAGGELLISSLAVGAYRHASEPRPPPLKG